jgi:hypothetical protein
MPMSVADIAQASTIWCRIWPQLKPIAIRARDAAGGNGDYGGYPCLDCQDDRDVDTR